MSYYQQKRTNNYSHGYRSNQSRPTPRRGKKEYINPSRFVQSAKPISSEEYSPVHEFADFAIEPLIKRNLSAKGFTAPLPIQDQAIPAGLAGQDIIGIANTGTGKTAAFAVPVLHQLMNHRDKKCLIMAPTRELATQIYEDCQSIGSGSGLFAALLIGGAAMGPQLRHLSRTPSIVIGTPGRIKDHVNRGSLNLSRFNIVVLDEVDRMLDMGFVNDMRLILKQIAPVRQSFFFSATLDSKVNQLIQEFSAVQTTISVKTGETVDTIEQSVLSYGSNSEKIEKLHDLLINQSTKAIVFDSTQRSVERLNKELLARGFSADAIHGGKSQSQRTRALKRFKSNDISILVATDVAARGLDVSDITHVINYSIPETYDDYVHRIGRAGRVGKAGYAVTFVES
jgi:superfamily II DNA/RNA helicase